MGHTHEWKTVFVAVCGSSPHTWGIPLLGLRMLLPDRFIPTHVGHTQDRAGMSTPRSVHPHIRGAYACYVPTIVYHIGSSPHTWGILPRECNTPRTHSVHPHIRGAYPYKLFRLITVDGSSPHTWGIPQQLKAQRDLDRFIPTYVGHTSGRIRQNGKEPVHPHIRGAYSSRRDTTSPLIGSSPHTWGIQVWDFVPRCKFRFIPTYVGHTG